MFRPEASVKRNARLAGDVFVAVPLSWQIIGYFLFGTVVAAFIFLISLDYSRVVTANGMITDVAEDSLSSRSGSVLYARLSVPGSAIGFVEPGQRVQLAIDAFPYQQFGTVRGRILEIGRAKALRRAADGKISSYFPVTVELDRSSLTAFGRARPLRPGMELVARIGTAKQTLWQWLFEPLYAVSGR